MALFLKLLGLLLLLWILQGPLPDGWFHFLDPRVWRRKPSREKILYLTFDDGPDPKATPLILDTLKDKGIPATFFVVGESALKHRELIQRARKEGHLLACHSFSHRHAYLLFPWEAVREVRESQKVLQTLTGEEPRYFRPPWGSFSLPLWWALRREKLIPVLWSILPGDWKPLSEEELWRRVRRLLKPGAILVLHDGRGHPEAPWTTARNLPYLLEKIRGEGYRFCRLDEAPQ